MSSIVEQMYTIMSGIGAITALVPASRIKPPGNWQNLTRPYIEHFPVSIDPTVIHGGLAALRIWDFYQISVYADSYSSGDAVARAIRDSLTVGVQSGEVTVLFQNSPWYIGRDDEMNVEHFALNFRVAEAL